MWEVMVFLFETVSVDDNQYSTSCKINVSKTSMEVRHGSKTPLPPFAMDFLFSETLNLLNRPLWFSGVFLDPRGCKRYLTLLSVGDILSDC